MPSITSRNQTAAARPTADRNKELYSLIKTGDVSAADSLIEENIGLAISIAKNFVGRNPAFADQLGDLTCTARLALTEAVRSVAARKASIRDVRAYITTAISHAIGEAAFEEAGFSPGYSTPRDLPKEKRGERPSCEGIETEASVRGLALDEPGYATIDEKDEIDACCLDDLDRKIVDLKWQASLREEVLTDADLARELRKPESTVSGRRRAIEHRYMERQYTLSA